jgi:hypothetical protein
MAVKETWRALARASHVTPPRDLTELVQLISSVPGVYWDRLLTRFHLTSDAVTQAWAQVTARAHAVDPMSEAALLAEWEPLVAALLAANRGDTDAARALEIFLAEEGAPEEVATFGRVLRQMWHGKHDREIIDGLGGSQRRIAAHALDVLTGSTAAPAELWPAIWIGPLLGEMVRAINGNGTSAAWVDHKLAEMAGRHPDLVRVLRRMRTGDHDPRLVDDVNDPADRAIVATILRYIALSTPDAD